MDLVGVGHKLDDVAGAAMDGGVALVLALGVSDELQRQGQGQGRSVVSDEVSG